MLRVLPGVRLFTRGDGYRFERLFYCLPRPLVHRPVGQGEAREEYERSHDGGGEVREVVVTDDWVDTDSGRETCKPREAQDLPQAPARSAALYAEERHDADRADAAAEARPVVGYQGDEPWVYVVEVLGQKTHECQVLRHEDTRHPNPHDRGSSGEHAECRRDRHAGPIPKSDLQ